MRKIPLLIGLLFLTACRPPGAETPAPTLPPPSQDQGLLLDGSFSDWNAYEPVYTDPEGDSGASGVDIGAIYIAHSENHLVFKIELGRMVDLDEEPALVMQVEQQGGPAIRYDFGAREGSFNGLSVNHASLGITGMPTYSSDTYEIAMRLNRFNQDADLAVSFSDPAGDGDQAPDGGGMIAYDWRSPLLPLKPLAIEKADPAAVRFMSYNVPEDGVLDSGRAGLFGRLFQALAPDVVLLQEARNRPPEDYEGQLEDWLGGDWSAIKQRDLIIASRLAFMDGWQDASAGLDVRIMPALLDVSGRPLLVFGAHLSCCSNEADRQAEVDGFVRYLREGPLGPGTPFLLMGDLNIVGSERPLRTLLGGDIADEARFGPDYMPDWDGTPLVGLPLRHSHSRMTYTWRDPANSYAPGRLDYFIYTDSLLGASGFILDTGEMPEDLLEALGLQAGDTAEASDHLPLVVDVTFLGSR